MKVDLKSIQKRLVLTDRSFANQLGTTENALKSQKEAGEVTDVVARKLKILLSQEEARNSFTVIDYESAYKELELDNVAEFQLLFNINPSSNIKYKHSGKIPPQTRKLLKLALYLKKQGVDWKTLFSQF